MTVTFTKQYRDPETGVVHKVGGVAEVTAEQLKKLADAGVISKPPEPTQPTPPVTPPPEPTAPVTPPPDAEQQEEGEQTPPVQGTGGTVSNVPPQGGPAKQ